MSLISRHEMTHRASTSIEEHVAVEDVLSSQTLCCGLQLEVWTCKDFPTQPPFGCESSKEQCNEFVQTKFGTFIERPWGAGLSLPASTWKQFLIEEAVLNWF